MLSVSLCCKVITLSSCYCNWELVFLIIFLNWGKSRFANWSEDENVSSSPLASFYVQPFLPLTHSSALKHEFCIQQKTYFVQLRHGRTEEKILKMRRKEIFQALCELFLSLLLLLNWPIKKSSRHYVSLFFLLWFNNLKF